MSFIEVLMKKEYFILIILSAIIIAIIILNNISPHDEEIKENYVIKQTDLDESKMLNSPVLDYKE